MKHTNGYKSGVWALVTGATSGIGYAYAEELAKQKKPIILVARNQAKLSEISEGLNKRFDVMTKTISADLSTNEGVNKVIEETEYQVIDLLINNAGKEDSGEFLTTSIEAMQSSIALNCSAPLALSHHFGKKMIERGGGNIMFLSSIVAFQGVPNIANYAATKAYSLVLAEGLAAELKSKKVGVSIVAPGFTQSNLSPQINFTDTPLKPLAADFVARYSLKKMGKQLIIIPGFINKLLFYLGKYIQPRKLNTFSFGRVFKMVLKDKLIAQKSAGANS